jgi:hypothetical protein
MSDYRTIKVRPITYRVLKVLAAQTGETMLDLIERLAKQEDGSVWRSVQTSANRPKTDK